MAGTGVVDPLAAAYEAIESHSWSDALAFFQEADAARALTGPALERLAEAAFFDGRADVVIEAKERGFKAYVNEGDPDRAAYLAIDLAREHIYKGNGSIASAWLRRAERILEHRPESYAHGYLALAHASAALGRGEIDAAGKRAEEAVRIGVGTGDFDLGALALGELGQARIAAGAVQEGMQLMDEAAVAAANGELSPFVTGVTYCRVISACRDLSDFARAGEWTEATERWCQRQSISGFPGICRVHRAEIVARSGAWDRAEQELVRATEELEAYNATPPMADGFYSLAEIRYRKGELEEAEAALRRAHALGRPPQPLLALIRLAQGNRRTAASAITAALDETDQDKWMRTRLLPAQVEIAVATGDVETARAAVEELTDLGASFDSLAMQAERDVARGRVLLAGGEPVAAIRRLRQAVQGWTKVAAPYELAVARSLLGEALMAVHDEDAAELELEAAHSEFARLGAARDAGRVAAQIREAAVRRHGPEQAHKTFMFTDIVASTNLAELLGDHAWDQLLRWHDETLRSAFATRGGEVVNSTGDGFFVAFDGAGQAIDCAIDVQRLLNGHRSSTGFAPMVRIGLHTAGANYDGTDYSGVGVHVASRVASLAAGEEILATADTLAEDGRSRNVDDSKTVDLKGVSDPVEVASIRWR